MSAQAAQAVASERTRDARLQRLAGAVISPRPIVPARTLRWRAAASAAGGMLLLLGFLLGRQFAAPDLVRPAEAAPTASARPERDVAPVAPGTVALETSGYVVARNKAFISSDITGRIHSIEVEVGQQVQEGEVIATLDDREARLRLAAAELRMQQDQLAVRAASIALTVARDRHEPMQRLWHTGAIADTAMDEARAALDTAQVKLELAELALAEARNLLESARMQVERHAIRAPFTGIVVEVTAREGETVSPSSGGNSFIRSGIVHLVDPNALDVVADVPELHFRNVRISQPVELLAKTTGGSVRRSEVAWIAPVSDRQRGTVQVGMRLNSGDGGFIDGMEVEVRFLQRQVAALGLGEEVPNDG